MRRARAWKSVCAERGCARVPYVKTDCSGRFEVAAMMVWRSRAWSFNAPGRAAETSYGFRAVLEMVGN